LADVRAGRQLHAADLHAAVGRVHPEFDLQLEVLRLAAAPDEKRVLLDRILLGALADDGVVLGAPERRIAVPALQRPAVEDRVEPAVIVHRQRICAARPLASAATAPVAAALRRLRLRGDGCSQADNERGNGWFHTAPACCDTATASQRPLFADLRTASVT